MDKLTKNRNVDLCLRLLQDSFANGGTYLDPPTYQSVEWFNQIVKTYRPDPKFFENFEVQDKLVINKILKNIRRVSNEDRYKIFVMQNRVVSILFMNYENGAVDPHITNFINKIETIEQQAFPNCKPRKIMTLFDYIESIKENLKSGDYKETVEYLGSFIYND